MNTEIIQVRNRSIHMTIDGVTVVGDILRLSANDMEVEIKEPFSGFKAGVHVPAFAMNKVNWLAIMEESGITERGRQTAASLLRRLYDHARGKRTGWPVSELTSTGWIEVHNGLTRDSKRMEDEAE